MSVLIDIENLEKIPNEKKCGIYFLFKEGELVYIGQSTHLEARLVNHNRRIDFDSYAFYPCDADQLDIVEYQNIKHYKPKFNIANNVKGRTKERKRRKEILYTFTQSNSIDNIPYPYRAAIRDASTAGGQYLDYIEKFDLHLLSDIEWMEFIKEASFAYHKYIFQNMPHIAPLPKE